MSFLDIFLAANAFLLGVVITLAIQYWFAHKNSQKPTAKGGSAAPVPPAVRERIVKQAEQNFQGIVNRSALQLQHDLGATGTQLNKLLEKFGSDVLDDEMRLFRANVADIRAHTQGALAGAQDQISEQQTAILKSLATRQAELDERMSQSFAAQKDELIRKLNDKLNDAVLAFLLETLGHDVDLGAQADYLVATLEANKAELVATAGGTTPQQTEAKQ